MVRRLPKSKRIKRKGASRDPEKNIIIICEGKNTEPNYISDFARDKKHPLVEIHTVEGVGSPKSIVDRAIAERKSLLRKVKKSGNSFDKNFEVWCVSDMDEHPRIREEMQRAKDNHLKYALSNPCIELWGYLHYSQHDAPTHRHNMQRMLTDVMPGYDHEKGAIFNYEHMKNRYPDAVNNAKDLEKRRDEEDDRNGNTSTGIYKLMESIATKEGSGK